MKKDKLQKEKKPETPIISNEEKMLNKLADRLKHYRQLRGFTNYEQFAYKFEINRTQYGRYEAGGNIQFTTLAKILEALDVSFEEFFKDF